MRRAVALIALLCMLVAAPAAQAAKRSWAKPQIEDVVTAGLMAPSVAEFRPNDVLTNAELAELVGMLGGVGTVADPASPVKLRQLDAALVRLLGGGAASKHVRSTLAAAGLRPTAFAGTETVARLLGLRTNHPQGEDARELGPNDPVTRAEAAYSVARLLSLRASGGAEATFSEALSFTLPELTEWQRRVLRRAVRFIGFPYIWGGSTERRQRPFGVDVPGGFDCSGFTWRVYKTPPFADAPVLSETLKGRTTYAMSGEVAANRRIGFGALQPGDVVFFGDRGPQSKPSQVGHMGVYVGGGWMAHSSSRGTTLVPVEGWYRDRFAWARRPLAEAGLQ
jgi:cell wall-associated NlpC family hydrolase